MITQSARSLNWWRNRRQTPGIDLGNGRMLDAEDVLESHYRRLSRAQQPPQTRRVKVQVEDNLTAAITVLAPDLAPLTSLAEEVAAAMPSVQPAPQFRRDLHRALERTHRQHAAQRALGTRRQPQQKAGRWYWPALAGLAAVSLVVLFVYWLGWRKHAPREFVSPL